MSTIGVGVIGFAHGHANTYCQQMVRFEDVRLVACWDDDEERGKRAAAHYTFSVFSVARIWRTHTVR